MKRTFISYKKLWALALLAVVAVSAYSCNGTADESSPTQPTGTELSPTSPTVTVSAIDESIVQVWDSGMLVATGVIIGDGSQVLTVLNLEESVPGVLDVVAAGGDRYQAFIQAIDPRIGATLLKLEAINLPAAATGDATSLVSEQKVIARWYQQPYIGNSPGEPELAKTDMLTYIFSAEAWVNFGINSPPGRLSDIPGVGQGGIITDEEGVVLGLLGVDYNSMFNHPHGIGMLPPVASINAALEFLSPDFAERPYAHGPLMIVIDSEVGTQLFLSYFPNYNVVTEAIQKIIRQLETPLPVDELPQDYHAVTVVGPADHNTVTVVYALPVELKSSDSTLIARARWVSIQWNRADGEPNLLFYGSGHWVLEGGFQLPDDLSGLLTAIDPLINYQPGL